MSAKKRKTTTSELQELYGSIDDILNKLKLKLSDGSVTGRYDSAVPVDLRRIALIAESIADQRPRSHKEWATIADVLDREGVHLWNFSTALREGKDSQDVFAALRFAGFRLIEAGLVAKPDTETLVHVLQLASKAGSSLADAGDPEAASKVLGSAAKYEEALRHSDDPLGTLSEAKARSTIMYYSSRMETAWKDKNEAVANFMLQKATENEQHLSILPLHDRELLVDKIFLIGRALLKTSSQETNTVSQAKSAGMAVKWIQRAFAIVEKTDEDASGRSELRRSILRSLARAYFLASSDDPENIVRAEASLQELMTSMDDSEDPTRADFQQLRWMRVAILKKRKASHSTLVEAFDSIIEHMSVSDTAITDILHELRTFGHDHALVSAAHQRLLTKILSLSDESIESHVDRLLLPMILHCGKDPDHRRAMQDAEASFQCLADARFEFTKISATACLTLLWQCGDRQYRSQRWSEAADWFLTGIHPAFQAISSVSDQKCYRKAALCYVQQKEYAKASAVLRRCSHPEAPTYYVALLIAVRQGLEDEAVNAVKNMVNASDFDRKMLLLATKLANESDMKGLLLLVLETLLDSIKLGSALESHGDAMTLTRCIVRLTLKLLAEPASNRVALVPTLIRHLSTAVTVISDLTAKQEGQTVLKDISWLWRTAYNSAIQSCTEWETPQNQSSQLFAVARDLIRLYLDSALAEAEPEVYSFLMNASFASIVIKVFALRELASPADEPLKADHTAKALEEIVECTKLIQDTLSSIKLSADDVERTRQYMRLLCVFRAEMLAERKQWDDLLSMTTDLTQWDSLAADTLEAIADILWNKDCPVDVLSVALQSILHASLDCEFLSIEKFSRWLRAICTILLSKNTVADRLQAISYVEQAVIVMQEHSGDNSGQHVYPVDERQWLLGTSYNTGVECLHSSSLDEAKRWFEICTAICRFVPDGTSRAEKISKTYSALLAQYPSGL